MLIDSKVTDIDMTQSTNSFQGAELLGKGSPVCGLMCDVVPCDLGRNQFLDTCFQQIDVFLLYLLKPLKLEFVLID